MAEIDWLLRRDRPAERARNGPACGGDDKQSKRTRHGDVVRARAVQVERRTEQVFDRLVRLYFDGRPVRDISETNSDVFSGAPTIAISAWEMMPLQHPPSSTTGTRRI